jgi:hypothetical protein
MDARGIPGAAVCGTVPAGVVVPGLVLGACVEGGTGAVEFDGGATAGGAPTVAAAGPLFAAIGAVAHVPTQWSGNFGAAWEAPATAWKASKTSRLGRNLRRTSMVTGISQPLMKSLSRTILRWFCRFTGP